MRLLEGLTKSNTEDFLRLTKRIFWKSLATTINGVLSAFVIYGYCAVFGSLGTWKGVLQLCMSYNSEEDISISLLDRIMSQSLTVVTRSLIYALCAK